MPAMDDFKGRVDYAASVIAARRNTSRAFDGCFENYDGDAVVVALVRRAERNERLAENLPRYICKSSLAEAVGRFEGQDLAEVARAMRGRAMARNGELAA